MGRQNKTIKSKRRRKRWNRLNKIAYRKLQGYSLGGLIISALGGIEYKNIKRFNRYRGPKDKLIKGKNNKLKDSLIEPNPLVDALTKHSGLRFSAGGKTITEPFEFHGIRTRLDGSKK